MSSTPSFSEFDPSHIPFQDQVIDDIYCNWDYSLGTHEALLSGSVGSAKSLLGAHLIVRHCLENSGARVLICRKALPQLRETIYSKIVEHLDQPDFKDGRDYFLNDSRCNVHFRNKSEILAITWADKKYKKIRSYEASCAFIEEGTENEGEDEQAFNEITMRCGRLPHIQHKWCITATNPDSPKHFLYKRFFIDKSKKRHVYLSKTEENPFLPKEYINGLKEILDPKMARRMLHGEWIEISQDVIYYSYSRDRNYKDYSYKVDNRNFIGISFDFNIGVGKPMSSCVFQYNGSYHFFNQSVIHGARTEDVLEDYASRGILDYPVLYKIYGDATGKSRSTSSLHSDYDIIKKYLSNYKTKSGNNINFEMCVPSSNPPIRTRHNIVNATCLNDNKECRLFVYKDAQTVDEGMRLTQLKKGSDYIEDDSPNCPYQHITTALGYAIVYIENDKKSLPMQIRR